MCPNTNNQVEEVFAKQFMQWFSFVLKYKLQLVFLHIQSNFANPLVRLFAARWFHLVHIQFMGLICSKLFDNYGTKINVWEKWMDCTSGNRSPFSCFVHCIITSLFRNGNLFLILFSRHVHFSPGGFLGFPHNSRKDNPCKI